MAGAQDAELCELLNALPPHLLAHICALIGAESLRDAFKRSGRLHRLWQESIVSTLNTGESGLGKRHAALINKYLKLRTIAIGSPPGRPVLQAIVEAPRLVSLDIKGPGALEAPGYIAGCPGACSRLTHMSIREPGAYWNDRLASPLAALTALASLAVEAASVSASHATLEQLAGSLRGLTHLELNTNSRASTALLSILPGSVTSLVSLHMASRFNTISQQPLPASALSQLTSLRSLSTNYSLDLAEEEQVALAELQELRELECSSEPTSFSSVSPPPYEFGVLAALGRLQSLQLPGYWLPAEHVYGHANLTRLQAHDLRAGGGGGSRGCEGGGQGGCPLRELQLSGAAERGLRGCPAAGRLVRLDLTVVGARECGALAQLLRCSAASLESVELRFRDLVQATCLAWPPEMPACTRLRTEVASREALAELGGCDWPVLRLLELRLHGAEEVRAMAQSRQSVAQHFSWLLGVPALERVALRVSGTRIPAGISRWLPQLVAAEGGQFKVEVERLAD
jgi:hypothetical protein